MLELYNFVSGPLAWAAFAIFILGCMIRILHLFVLLVKKEAFIFTYMSLKHAGRSLFHWSIPFGTENMRRHPIMTVVTYAFHVCLILTPLFLLAHVVLWEDAWPFAWGYLPEWLTDIMTLVVIFGCLFFLIRRLTVPEVQYVTSVSDYVIIAIVAAPFVTGFFAYHQWFNYPLMMILHIVTGEIMLVAIPFTRLVHMVLAPFTRAYMGSEFGNVRHAKDW